MGSELRVQRGHQRPGDLPSPAGDWKRRSPTTAISARLPNDIEPCTRAVLNTEVIMNRRFLASVITCFLIASVGSILAQAPAQPAPAGQGAAKGGQRPGSLATPEDLADIAKLANLPALGQGLRRRRFFDGSRLHACARRNAARRHSARQVDRVLYELRQQQSVSRRQRPV